MLCDDHLMNFGLLLRKIGLWTLDRLEVLSEEGFDRLQSLAGLPVITVVLDV